MELNIQKHEYISDVRYDPSRVRSDDKTQTNDVSDKQTEEKSLHHVIAEHCLPKLVCELHRKQLEEFESFSESERSLVSLIGYVS